MKWVRERWSQLRASIDIRDVHIYGGLVLAGTGAWLVSPPLALTGVGVALTLMGLAAGVKR